MAKDAVFLAGNLVFRVFEHCIVLDKVADLIIKIVGPVFAISNDLADFVAVIVLKIIKNVD